MGAWGASTERGSSRWHRSRQSQRRWGGRTVRGAAAESFASGLQSLVAEFEKQSEDWRDGYAIRFGFGPFFLAEDGQEFAIEAPDYDGDPRQRTRDLTTALFAITAIVSTPAQVGLSPLPIGPESVAICAEGWQKTRTLTLARTEPKGTDSGWFIAPFQPDRREPWPPESLQPVQVGALLAIRPAILRVLGLPPGHTAVLDGEAIRMVLRDADGSILLSGGQ